MLSEKGIRDVIIVGGGPSGSSAARELAKRGHSVLILEGREKIGIPIQCGECISDNTLGISEVSRYSDSICSKMSGYRIISPSGGSIYLSSNGWNIRRNLFDREMMDMAISEGTELKLSEHVTGIDCQDGKFEVVTMFQKYRARSLIMACGANDPILKEFQNVNPRIRMRAIEAKMDIHDESTEIRFYVKGPLKGGYGWYFPRGYEVNVGLITFENVKNEFELLIDRLKLDRKRIKSFHGGSVPVSGMSDVNPIGNTILVGDAGGFANPISKGGIIGAILSGKEGAKAISNTLSGDENAIMKWKESMQKHPAFDPINLDRNEILSSLDDNALDQLTSIVGGRDVRSIRKTELLREAWKRPELLKSAKGYLKLLKGFKDWARWAF